MLRIVCASVALAFSVNGFSHTQDQSQTPTDSRFNALNTGQLSGAAIHFTGMAFPRSAMHKWIEDSVGKNLNYSVPYEISFTGELAQMQFSGPEEFAQFINYRPNRPDILSKDNASVKNSWDPEQFIPSPPNSGSPGDISSGCRAGFFGHPPQAATVEYEWTYMQSDTNENGVIDEEDEWDWRITSYSVNFPAQNASLPRCD